jgi:hypothetical protein
MIRHNLVAISGIMPWNFREHAIDCHVEAPQEIPQLEMSGEKRRNIFSFPERDTQHTTQTLWCIRSEHSH